MKKQDYFTINTSEGAIRVLLAKDLPEQVGRIVLHVHSDFQSMIEQRTKKDARKNKKILKQNYRYRLMLILLLTANEAFQKQKDYKRFYALDSEEVDEFFEAYFKFKAFSEILALEKKEALKELEKALKALEAE